MKKLKLNYKKISSFLYGLTFIILLSVAGLVGLSALNLPGNYKLFVVQSGSMEPSVKKMSMILSKPKSDYQKGDIITVTDPGNNKVSITHRIFDVENKDGKISYITKGDANNDADTEKRPKENVIGKVMFSLPLIGYPVSFAKTKEGLIILVVIPATLIIYSEILTIKNEAVRLFRESKKRKLTAFEKVEEKIGEEIIEVEKDLKKIIKPKKSKK